MITVKTQGNLDKSTRKLAPAMTDDAEEKQLISLARQRSLERLQNGTASAQEIVYWLKIGSSEKRTELEIMEEQKKLLIAKTKAIADSESSAKAYTDAIAAMKSYSGVDEEMDDDESFDIF